MRHPTPPEAYVGPRIKFLNHSFTRKILEIARAREMDELTIMHGRILGLLYWNDDRDIFQKDIEETFNITRSSVTGIVKLMEKKGYILRQSVQGDARLKKLSLTDLGRRACESSWEVFQEVETLAAQGLTAEQLQTFFSLCDMIQENLTPKKECAHGKNHSIPSKDL